MKTTMELKYPRKFSKKFSVFVLVLFASCSTVSFTKDNGTDQVDLIVLDFPNFQHSFEYRDGWFECLAEFVRWHHLVAEGNTPEALNSDGIHNVLSDNFAPDAIGGSINRFALKSQGFTDCRASLLELRKLHGDGFVHRLVVRGLINEDIVLADASSLYNSKFLAGLQEQE